jgi:hypothetical protein
MLRRLVEIDWSFGGNYCLHRQDDGPDVHTKDYFVE